MEKTEAQALMLENRIRKRFRHLRKWAKRIGTDAFRLYNRDIPEIPLVVDYYGQWVSAALYQRPYEKDEAEERHWLAAMTQAIAAGLELPESQVFLKERKRQRGKNQYQKLRDTQVVRQVREGGLTFQVNLSDYLDTGLFLDRRKARDLLRKEAAGKRVLNLFAYTCSFSVYAAAGGAQEIDSVDLSNTYLDWGKLNFRLNGFEAGSRYRFIAAETEDFLRRGIRNRRTWDSIILDPPSFSNSKKMTGALDIRRDYKRLISQSLEVLDKKGTLWFSANAKGFRLNPAEFPELHIENLQPLIIDEDFIGKKIPSCYKISRSAPLARS
ncbi:MAG: class I SAM-dependent methyltransferase [Spirochaetaceae bacterium]|nr:class I SAM-dependent methyltransferase [Spirochaetaceae bacterium]